jgi:hypothetical protein
MSSLASTPAVAPLRQPDVSGAPVSREFKLVLASCSVQEKQDTVLRSLLEISLDWPLVLRLAEHHNVMPLVYQGLRELPDGIPPAIRDELRLRFENNARKNLRFTAELMRVMECLESHNIAAIPFKGPVLAEAVYGNIALREFSDLDVLVRRCDFLQAKEALRTLGFVPGWKLSATQERAYLVSGYECAFDGPAGRNLLELQWGILPAFYAVDLPVEELLERASQTSLGDKAVKTLSAEDLLLTLCVHAAKHGWIRLCWLRDIAGVVSWGEIDWKRVMQKAEELGVERMVRISLRLANQLLGADVPRLKPRRDDAMVDELCDRITRAMPDSEDYSTESLSYFRLMLQLRERRSDQLRFASRLLFTPSIGEWSLVRLPAPLFPLYRVIRLFRVAGRFLRLGRAASL